MPIAIRLIFCYSLGIMSELIKKLRDAKAANDAMRKDAFDAIEHSKAIIAKAEKDNVHLEFVLNLLGETVTQDAIEPQTKQPSLRQQAIDVIDLGETVGVGEAHDRLARRGVTTTRATVNVTLHNLVKQGKLEKVSLGLYRKPVKGETPKAVTDGVSVINQSPSQGNQEGREHV